MQGLFDFVVKPKGSRYNNVKKIGDIIMFLEGGMTNRVLKETVEATLKKISILFLWTRYIYIKIKMVGSRYQITAS